MTDADRAVAVCSLLCLGVLLAVVAIDPWIWRRLTRREQARVLVEETEQHLRDDHDRITLQSLATRLEEPPR